MTGFTIDSIETSGQCLGPGLESERNIHFGEGRALSRSGLGRRQRADRQSASNKTGTENRSKPCVFHDRSPLEGQCS
jgi:hypothetical protein